MNHVIASEAKQSPVKRVMQIEWQIPLNQRLLLEDSQHSICLANRLTQVQV